MERYKSLAVSDNIKVIYDSVNKKTLILRGEVSNDLLRQYDNTSRSPEVTHTSLSTFMINISESCNLRCRYCSRYRNDYSSDRSISREMLKSVLRRIIEYSESISRKCVVQFHGGEPSLKFMDIKYVLDSMDYKQVMSHLDLRIQTNGTYFPDELIKLCLKYDIQIGISIDGPEYITDKIRRYNNGEGVTRVVETNIGNLLSQVPNERLSILCVLTKENVPYADEIYHYFKELGIVDFSLIPLYNDFSQAINDTTIIPTNSEMSQFTKRIIDLWIEDLMHGNKVFIPNIQSWVWNLLSHSSNKLTACKTCCGTGQRIAFVEINGDLYPCGPLSYHQGTKTGNILDNNFPQNVFSSVIYNTIENRTVDKCSECALQGICKGGCPVNAYFHFKDINRLDPYCSYWEETILHLIGRLADDPVIITKIPMYTLRK